MRVPQLKLTEDQKKEISNAKAELIRIRSVTTDNQFLIPAPDDPITDSAQSFGPFAEVVTSTTRLATPETMSGL